MCIYIYIYIYYHIIPAVSGKMNRGPQHLAVAQRQVLPEVVNGRANLADGRVQLPREDEQQ